MLLDCEIKLDKSRVGIIQSYACGDSAGGVSKYGYMLDTSYLSMKQEAHLLWQVGDSLMIVYVCYTKL